MGWIHETLQKAVGDNKDSMLQILCGGKQYDGLAGTPFAEGNYYEPTIVAVDPDFATKMTSQDKDIVAAARDRVADLHHTNALFQTELFGPVVVVAPFYDRAHAIQMANDTPFGLGASIWSHDLTEAQALASKVRAGIGKWLARLCETVSFSSVFSHTSCSSMDQRPPQEPSFVAVGRFNESIWYRPGKRPRCLVRVHAGKKHCDELRAFCVGLVPRSQRTIQLK